MQKIKQVSDYLNSFIFGKEIDKSFSKISGELIVYYIKGRYILNTKSANYSYGALQQAFRRVLMKIKIYHFPVKNCLMLGFGTDSVVSVLQEEFKMKCWIFAIENDDEIIHLGKKYFNTQRFTNLELIKEDAFSYVLNCKDKFDLILFDIYIDNKIPSQFESNEFIKALRNILSPNGLIVFNKDLNAPEMKKSLEKLDVIFKQNFTEIKTVRPFRKSLFYVLKN